MRTFGMVFIFIVCFAVGVAVADQGRAAKDALTITTTTSPITSAGYDGVHSSSGGRLMYVEGGVELATFGPHSLTVGGQEVMTVDAFRRESIWRAVGFALGSFLGTLLALLLRATWVRRRQSSYEKKQTPDTSAYRKKV